MLLVSHSNCMSVSHRFVATDAQSFCYRQTTDRTARQDIGLPITAAPQRLFDKCHQTLTTILANSVNLQVFDFDRSLYLGDAHKKINVNVCFSSQPSSKPYRLICFEKNFLSENLSSQEPMGIKK